MTNEDEQRQVGKLVLDLQSAENELSHHKELLADLRMHVAAVNAHWDDLRVDSTGGLVDDHGGVPCTLPTVAQIADAVTAVSRLQRDVQSLRERLRKLKINI
ncbi:MAG: hypothetical protein F4Y57_10980 [Acidobacteria bacterium]|nr:hypothetical protein [Acidobacteriota bacterium]